MIWSKTGITFMCDARFVSWLTNLPYCPKVFRLSQLPQTGENSVADRLGIRSVAVQIVS